MQCRSYHRDLNPLRHFRISTDMQRILVGRLSDIWEVCPHLRSLGKAESIHILREVVANRAAGEVLYSMAGLL